MDMPMMWGFSVVQCVDEAIPPELVLCRLSCRTSGHMGGIAHGIAVPRPPDSSSMIIYGEKGFVDP